MAALGKVQRALLALVALLSALAGVANYAAFAAVPRFLLATGALAGLAWVVSLGTEEVGVHFGPALTGFLQSTLGNLPELFVVIFALNAGELVVAQSAIVGSLLANALLVLGIVIIVGANRAEGGVMRFSPRLPNDTATLLIITAFIIVLLGLVLDSHEGSSHHVRAISIVGAGCLLVVYLAWLVPYLRSGERPALPGGDARLGLAPALAMLAIAGVGSAFVSEWFVDSLRPAIQVIGFSRAFVGIVVVAIAGNAVENAVGVTLAAKGRSDLAIAVVKNSVAQIAAFLFPVLILVSLALSTQLTFALRPVYTGAITLMALAVWQVTGDGEAASFEGWALVAIYVVVAFVVAFD